MKAKNTFQIGFIGIITVFVFTCTTDVFAQPFKSDGKKKGFIAKFDKDSDGRVSKEEFPGPDARFEQMDKNQDGYIDGDEVPKGRPSSGKKGRKGGKGFVEDLDKDSDGRVSREEFPGSGERFEQMDKNRDGYIDKDEASIGRPPRVEKEGLGE